MTSENRFGHFSCEQVSRAYGLLSDVQRRTRYDELLIAS